MKSDFLRGICIISVPIQLLLSIIFLLRGHSAPGGGFIGGLICGIGITFYLLVHHKLPSVLVKIEPITIMATGLAIAILASILGFLRHGIFLSAWWTGSIMLPLIGEVKLGSVLLFDFGVYVLVVGLITKLMTLLHEEIK